MRRGNYPQTLTNKKGQLFCIATGSDATAEHEGGSEELLQALTGHSSMMAPVVAGHLRSGVLAEIPDLLAHRHIVANLDNIIYDEQLVDGEVQAALGYQRRGTLQFFGRDGYPASELWFATFGEPKDMTGAWDSQGFAFKVRGERQVAQLREFAQAVKAGNAMFAGRFLEGAAGRPLAGVVIARCDLMRPEHRKAMQAAQASFAADVELHLRARMAELHELVRARRPNPGYVWPVWVDAAKTEVGYNLNPGYGIKAEYGGPYSFEQLRDWLLGGCATLLRRAA